MAIEIEFLTVFSKKRVRKNRYDRLEDFLTIPVKVHQGQVVAREIEAGTVHEDKKVGVRFTVPDDKETASYLGNKLSMSERNPGDIVSQINGFLCAHDERLTVTRIFEVFADINMHAGNISEPSPIRIHGGITGGVKIRSNSDIEVLGLMENAEIHAGGNLLLRGGLTGNGELVSASSGKDLYVKFVQQGKLESGGSITIDGPVMNSDLAAAKKITLRGKARLVGGVTMAKEEISTPQIGSEAATPTDIKLGKDPFLSRRKKKRAETLQNAQEILAVNTGKIRIALNNLDGMPEFNPEDLLSYIFHMSDMTREGKKEGLSNDKEECFTQLGGYLLSTIYQKDQLKKIEAEVASDESYDAPCKNASLKAISIAHPGVKISIIDETITLDREYENIRFAIKNGKIRPTALK